MIPTTESNHERATIRKRGWLVLASGAIATILAVVVVDAMLPTAMPASALRLVLLAVGLTLSCCAFWRTTRSAAGEGQRADIPGIIALAALMPMSDNIWIRTFGAGSWSHHLASLLQTMVAVGAGMIICKWLLAVDNREAAARSSAGPS